MEMVPARLWRDRLEEVAVGSDIVAGLGGRKGLGVLHCWDHTWSLTTMARKRAPVPVFSHNMPLPMASIVPSHAFFPAYLPTTFWTGQVDLPVIYQVFPAGGMTVKWWRSY